MGDSDGLRHDAGFFFLWRLLTFLHRTPVVREAPVFAELPTPELTERGGESREVGRWNGLPRGWGGIRSRIGLGGGGRRLVRGVAQKKCWRGSSMAESDRS